MNSQKDDYLNHTHTTGFMQIYAVGIQDVVKTRTKSLKTEIFNTLCSRCLDFQIFIRSCSSPGTSRIEPGDSMHSFLLIINRQVFQAIIRLWGRLSHNGGKQPSINLLLLQNSKPSLTSCMKYMSFTVNLKMLCTYHDTLTNVAVCLLCNNKIIAKQTTLFYHIL